MLSVRRTWLLFCIPILYCGIFGCWVPIASAQQNLFNIPSGVITEKGQFFYQNQTNYYPLNGLETKNHFVFGVTKRLEFGFNVLNTALVFKEVGVRAVQTNLPGADPLTNIVVLTAQGKIIKHKAFHVTLGTQMGASARTKSRYIHFAQLHYGLFVWKPKKQTLISIGPYIANQVMAGDGSPVGIMAGFEVPVYRDVVIAMGDSKIGTNRLSTTVVGGAIQVAKGVQICLGALIPTTIGYQNKWGAVFELNLYNF
jgi:hypothetical protein